MPYRITLPVITCFSLTLAGLANADVPNVFSAGSPARASEVNENFSNLDQRVSNLAFSLDNLEQELKSPGRTAETTINCADDSDAFKKAVEEDFKKITIEGGNCNADIMLVDQTLFVDGTDSTVLVTDPTSEQKLFEIRNGSEVLLKNLEVRGAIASMTTSQFYLYNATVHCENHGWALFASSASYTYLDDVTLRGCEPIHAEAADILAYGSVRLYPAAEKSAINLIGNAYFEGLDNSKLSIVIEEQEPLKTRVIQIWDSSTLNLQGENQIEGSMEAYGNSQINIKNLTWTNAKEAKEQILLTNNSSLRLKNSGFYNKKITTTINSSARLFDLTSGSWNTFIARNNSAIYVRDAISGEGNRYVAIRNATILYDSAEDPVLTLNDEVSAYKGSIIEFKNPQVTYTGSCDLSTGSYFMVNDIAQECSDAK